MLFADHCLFRQVFNFLLTETETCTVRRRDINRIDALSRSINIVVSKCSLIRLLLNCGFFISCCFFT